MSINPEAETLLDKLASHVEDEAALASAVESTRHGLGDPMFGEIVGDNLQKLSSANSEELAPDQALYALGFLSEAALRASADYLGARPDVAQDRKFWTALRELQQIADECGGITLLPERYAMTPEEGARMAEFADKRLGELDEQVQIALARGNYAFWNEDTMATGIDVLDSSPAELLERLQSGEQRAMPHLTLTNHVHEHLVAALAELSSEARVNIYDIGAGSGATMAGIVAGVGRAAERRGPELGQVSLVGVEIASHFMKFLNERFLPVAHERLTAGGASSHIVRNELVEGAGSSPITFLHMGAKEMVTERLRASYAHELDVFVANYALHRLPTRDKVEMFRAIADRCPNPVILIGDLASNSSDINRRHFNFHRNGILNPGNIRIRENLEDAGYQVLSLDEAPFPVPPELVRAIAERKDDDLTYLIASRGSGTDSVSRSLKAQLL